MTLKKISTRVGERGTKQVKIASKDWFMKLCIRIRIFVLDEATSALIKRLKKYFQGN